MRTQDFVRAAAGVLVTVLAAGGAYAQSQSDVSQPDPTTMTDTAPTPAMDRSSTGAVILMDEPVLAQRQALTTAMERSAVDTQSMGAGPARVLRDTMTREELRRQRALDAAQPQRGTPK